MNTAVPVILPAGFELTEHARCSYTLSRHGRTIGSITLVEGVYLARRGIRPDAAAPMGRFPSLRQAINALIT